MMKICWFELFLTVLQGDIGDTGGSSGGGGGGGFPIVVGVQESCSST